MESARSKQVRFEKGITGSHYQASNPRSSRTRTLIQLGGILDKSGLVTAFDIALGDDLQRDEHTFDPAAALLGALLELNKQLQEDGQNDKGHVNQMKLWRLKGKKALME
ncbi:MAG: conjugal transfer protein TraD [Alphaproteobacteria bacterium]|nr:conjugal transfer protein TraD [Alphaproteobacteria bacterium]